MTNSRKKDCVSQQICSGSPYRAFKGVKIHAFDQKSLYCERCPCWLTGGRNTALFPFSPKEERGNVGLMTG